MAPIPQEHSPVSAGIEPPQNLNVGKIVISGMSGLYPKSHNVKEFSEILYSKISPLTAEDVRFKYNHPEVVQHAGSIPGLGYFDAQFFKVHYRLANSMDPMGQKVLEQAYQAIYDAGVNPDQLSGKKVGVYIGSCFSETEKACFYEAANRTGFGIAGCSKTMFANRISYWLNAKGPSMAIDEACCSSTAALEQAYLAISRGECEAAIVGGSYLCLHPQSSVHFGRIIKLCADGKTKSFDEHADGCAKSEAINILFLQKGTDALRIYAEVLQAKTEFTCMLKDETGPKYGFYRSLSSTTNFIKKFYEDAKVSPQAIEYVEAFGCALPEADKVELQAIEEVFCNNRDDPLLIGSVMSNIGYGEAASGISAITKVLLGYHTGKLAANLHCKHPRQDIAGLRDGRMRIITEHQPFRSTYVAVNGMSMTGVNSHVLLHGHNKPKDLSRYKSSIPYLVHISGRHDEAVKAAIDILKTNPIDAEQLALLHNIHKTSVSGHMGRGYVVIKSDENQETVSVAEKAQFFDDAKRPLWFVYSGMGSQWAGMGEQLMRIPIFAAAIERCNRVLAPKGIDILHIITSPDEKIFNNILHSFVGIAAIQIGLTDILHELGLKPDGIIGHSVGELGCAYADGCLTAEEMILSAYYRGLVSLETKFIHGSMAAVGIGYERVKEICPPEIDVACHNSSESSTISGPADVMKVFVAELTSKEIFAKEVPCSNIAYHSRYIATAGPHLLKYLKQSISSPKARSERWISSSVPQDRWDEPIAKTCSPEYLTNNLLNPVLFEETSRLIPNNAVLVEIAPHGLLQAILKRSMPSGCKNIPLTRRKHPDNTLMLLEAIGQLYVEGFNSNIQVLYPKVQMPVSNGTPFLSHFVKWAHGEKWPLAVYHSANRRTAAICDFVVALQDKEHYYLEGHSIRGSTLYPFAACLTLAWDTLAMIMNVPRKQLSVQFNDIELHVQPVLHKRRQLKLNVSIHRGTGRFEILADGLKVVTGFINPISKKEKIHTDLDHVSKRFNLTSEDIYQLFRDRNYSYSGEFQSIHGVDESLSEALIVWRNNWVTFIDGVLQLNALRQTHNAVTLVTRVRKIIINVNEQMRVIDASKTTGEVLMKAKFYEEFDNTRCGGVLIENVKYQNLPPVQSSKVILKALAPVSTGNLGQESYVPVKESQILTDNVTLQSEESGCYESLKWVAAPVLTGPGVTVTVHYAGINSNDIKKANGSFLFNLTGNNYGSDFSGITDKGERVMGILASGSASSQIRAQPDLLWQVPAHWSLEDAATVPLAYAQAFYCLGIKTKVDKSMTILMHGGAGALGQAVISIALALGCEIYTTVSDMRKKRFLQKLFPSLKDDHIGCSRDHTFADMILIASKNRGCDIVISCLKEDLKTINMNCMNYSGILLDISQLQNYDNYSFGMSNLQRERNYVSVDFSSIFKNSGDIKMLKKMITEGIATGYVRPLTRVTYPAQEPARAFQLLAKSQHRGRVLLRMKDNVLQAQQRLRCSADRYHLIFCTEATFRLQLADILVTRGVRKLYLHVKKQSYYLHHKIRLWRAMGVEVVVSSIDLNERNVSALFNDILKLGALEGVYFTVNDKNDKLSENLIRLLDSSTRKSGTELRYFCVLNIGDHSTGKDVCIRRSADNLPATVLTVPELKEDFSRYRATIDALEQALLSNHSVLRAQIDSVSQPSLLQLLATITGIHIPDKVDKNLTLQDLGIEQHKFPLICSVLKLQYNVKFDEEHLSSLTIEDICAYEQKVIELPYDDVKGLSTFFNYVDSDELLATTDMVLMPTLGISTSMRDDEFDPDKEYLCIVPGMEGHHERFRVLCERSKLPAIVLQPGLDRPDETVKETAERFAELLLKKTGLKNSFYLMGYESGVLVALEVAAILEKQGLTGTVFCLGYGPHELQQELEEHLKQYKNEDQLQDAVLRHMFALMAKDDTARLESTLKNVSTWSEKIDACIRILLGRVSHSAQYAKALIQCALGRINQVRRNNSVVKPLSSRLVLLQAATEHKRTQNTLQQYSRQPISVHQLGTSLAYCAEDLSCAAIVNEYLDPAILENFSKQNILESYLLNANSFMAKNIEAD